MSQDTTFSPVRQASYRITSRRLSTSKMGKSANRSVPDSSATDLFSFLIPKVASDKKTPCHEAAIRSTRENPHMVHISRSRSLGENPKSTRHSFLKESVKHLGPPVDQQLKNAIDFTTINNLDNLSSWIESQKNLSLSEAVKTYGITSLTGANFLNEKYAKSIIKRMESVNTSENKTGYVSNKQEVTGMNSLSSPDKAQSKQRATSAPARCRRPCQLPKDSPNSDIGDKKTEVPRSQRSASEDRKKETSTTSKKNKQCGTQQPIYDVVGPNKGAERVKRSEEKVTDSSPKIPALPKRRDKRKKPKTQDTGPPDAVKAETTYHHNSTSEKTIEDVPNKPEIEDVPKKPEQVCELPAQEQLCAPLEDSNSEPVKTVEPPRERWKSSGDSKSVKENSTIDEKCNEKTPCRNQAKTESVFEGPCFSDTECKEQENDVCSPHLTSRQQPIPEKRECEARRSCRHEKSGSKVLHPFCKRKAISEDTEWTFSSGSQPPSGGSTFFKSFADAVGSQLSSLASRNQKFQVPGMQGLYTPAMISMYYPDDMYEDCDEGDNVAGKQDTRPSGPSSAQDINQKSAGFSGSKHKSQTSFDTVRQSESRESDKDTIYNKDDSAAQSIISLGQSLSIKSIRTQKSSQGLGTKESTQSPISKPELRQSTIQFGSTKSSLRKMTQSPLVCDKESVFISDEEPPFINEPGNLDDIESLRQQLSENKDGLQTNDDQLLVQSTQSVSFHTGPLRSAMRTPVKSSMIISSSEGRKSAVHSSASEGKEIEMTNDGNASQFTVDTHSSIMPQLIESTILIESKQSIPISEQINTPECKQLDSLAMHKDKLSVAKTPEGRQTKDKLSKLAMSTLGRTRDGSRAATMSGRTQSERTEPQTPQPQRTQPQTPQPERTQPQTPQPERTQPQTPQRTQPQTPQRTQPQTPQPQCTHTESTPEPPNERAEESSRGLYISESIPETPDRRTNKAISDNGDPYKSICPSPSLEMPQTTAEGRHAMAIPERTQRYESARTTPMSVCAKEDYESRNTTGFSHTSRTYDNRSFERLQEMDEGRYNMVKSEMKQPCEYNRTMSTAGRTPGFSERRYAGVHSDISEICQGVLSQERMRPRSMTERFQETTGGRTNVPTSEETQARVRMHSMLALERTQRTPESRYPMTPDRRDTAFRKIGRGSEPDGRDFERQDNEGRWPQNTKASLDRCVLEGNIQEISVVMKGEPTADYKRSLGKGVPGRLSVFPQGSRNSPIATDDQHADLYPDHLQSGQRQQNISINKGRPSATERPQSSRHPQIDDRRGIMFQPEPRPGPSDKQTRRGDPCEKFTGGQELENELPLSPELSYDMQLLPGRKSMRNSKGIHERDSTRQYPKSYPVTDAPSRAGEKHRLQNSQRKSSAVSHWHQIDDNFDDGQLQTMAPGCNCEEFHSNDESEESSFEEQGEETTDFDSLCDESYLSLDSRGQSRNTSPHSKPRKDITAAPALNVDCPGDIFGKKGGEYHIRVVPSNVSSSPQSECSSFKVTVISCKDRHHKVVSRRSHSSREDLIEYERLTESSPTPNKRTGADCRQREQSTRSLGRERRPSKTTHASAYGSDCECQARKRTENYTESDYESARRKSNRISDNDDNGNDICGCDERARRNGILSRPSVQKSSSRTISRQNREVSVRFPSWQYKEADLTRERSESFRPRRGNEPGDFRDQQKHQTLRSSFIKCQPCEKNQIGQGRTDSRNNVKLMSTDLQSAKVSPSTVKQKGESRLAAKTTSSRSTNSIASMKNKVQFDKARGPHHLKDKGFSKMSKRFERVHSIEPETTSSSQSSPIETSGSGHCDDNMDETLSTSSGDLCDCSEAHQGNTKTSKDIAYTREKVCGEPDIKKLRGRITFRCADGHTGRSHSELCKNAAVTIQKGNIRMVASPMGSKIVRCEVGDKNESLSRSHVNPTRAEDNDGLQPQKKCLENFLSDSCMDRYESDRRDIRKRLWTMSGYCDKLINSSQNLQSSNLYFLNRRYNRQRSKIQSPKSQSPAIASRLHYRPARTLRRRRDRREQRHSIASDYRSRSNSASRAPRDKSDTQEMIDRFDQIVTPPMQLPDRRPLKSVKCVSSNVCHSLRSLVGESAMFNGSLSQPRPLVLSSPKYMYSSRGIYCLEELTVANVHRSECTRLQNSGGQDKTSPVKKSTLHNTTPLSMSCKDFLHMGGDNVTNMSTGPTPRPSSANGMMRASEKKTQCNKKLYKPSTLGFKECQLGLQRDYMSSSETLTEHASEDSDDSSSYASSSYVGVDDIWQRDTNFSSSSRRNGQHSSENGGRRESEYSLDVIKDLSLVDSKYTVSASNLKMGQECQISDIKFSSSDVSKKHIAGEESLRIVKPLQTLGVGRLSGRTLETFWQNRLLTLLCARRLFVRWPSLTCPRIEDENLATWMKVYSSLNTQDCSPSVNVTSCNWHEGPVTDSKHELLYGLNSNAIFQSAVLDKFSSRCQVKSKQTEHLSSDSSRTKKIVQEDAIVSRSEIWERVANDRSEGRQRLQPKTEEIRFSNMTNEISSNIYADNYRSRVLEYHKSEGPEILNQVVNMGNSKPFWKQDGRCGMTFHLNKMSSEEELNFRTTVSSKLNICEDFTLIPFCYGESVRPIHSCRTEDTFNHWPGAISQLQPICFTDTPDVPRGISTTNNGSGSISRASADKMKIYVISSQNQQNTDYDTEMSQNSIYINNSGGFHLGYSATDETHWSLRDNPNTDETNWRLTDNPNTDKIHRCLYDICNTDETRGFYKCIGNETSKLCGIYNNDNGGCNQCSLEDRTGECQKLGDQMQKKCFRASTDPYNKYRIFTMNELIRVLEARRNTDGQSLGSFNLFKSERHETDLEDRPGFVDKCSPRGAQEMSSDAVNITQPGLVTERTGYAGQHKEYETHLNSSLYPKGLSRLGRCDITDVSGRTSLEGPANPVLSTRSSQCVESCSVGNDSRSISNAIVSDWLGCHYQNSSSRSISLQVPNNQEKGRELTAPGFLKHPTNDNAVEMSCCPSSTSHFETSLCLNDLACKTLKYKQRIEKHSSQDYKSGTIVLPSSQSKRVLNMCDCTDKSAETSCEIEDESDVPTLWSTTQTHYKDGSQPQYSDVRSETKDDNSDEESLCRLNDKPFSINKSHNKNSSTPIRTRSSGLSESSESTRVSDTFSGVSTLKDDDQTSQERKLKYQQSPLQLIKALVNDQLKVFFDNALKRWISPSRMKCSRITRNNHVRDNKSQVTQPSSSSSLSVSGEESKSVSGLYAKQVANSVSQRSVTEESIVLMETVDSGKVDLAKQLTDKACINQAKPESHRHKYVFTVKRKVVCSQKRCPRNNKYRIWKNKSPPSSECTSASVHSGFDGLNQRNLSQPLSLRHDQIFPSYTRIYKKDYMRNMYHYPVRKLATSRSIRGCFGRKPPAGSNVKEKCASTSYVANTRCSRNKYTGLSSGNNRALSKPNVHSKVIRIPKYSDSKDKDRKKALTIEIQCQNKQGTPSDIVNKPSKVRASSLVSGVETPLVSSQDIIYDRFLLDSEVSKVKSKGRQESTKDEARRHPVIVAHKRQEDRETQGKSVCSTGVQVNKWSRNDDRARECTKMAMEKSKEQTDKTPLGRCAPPTDKHMHYGNGELPNEVTKSHKLLEVYKMESEQTKDRPALSTGVCGRSQSYQSHQLRATAIKNNMLMNKTGDHLTREIYSDNLLNCENMNPCLLTPIKEESLSQEHTSSDKSKSNADVLNSECISKVIDTSNETTDQVSNTDRMPNYGLDDSRSIPLSHLKSKDYALALDFHEHQDNKIIRSVYPREHVLTPYLVKDDSSEGQKSSCYDDFFAYLESRCPFKSAFLRQEMRTFVHGTPSELEVNATKAEDELLRLYTGPRSSSFVRHTNLNPFLFRRTGNMNMSWRATENNSELSSDTSSYTKSIIDFSYKAIVDSRISENQVRILSNGDISSRYTPMKYDRRSCDFSHLPTQMSDNIFTPLLMKNEKIVSERECETLQSINRRYSRDNSGLEHNNRCWLNANWNENANNGNYVIFTDDISRYDLLEMHDSEESYCFIGVKHNYVTSKAGSDVSLMSNDILFDDCSPRETRHGHKKQMQHLQLQHESLDQLQCLIQGRAFVFVYSFHSTVEADRNIQESSTKISRRKHQHGDRLPLSDEQGRQKEISEEFMSVTEMMSSVLHKKHELAGKTNHKTRGIYSLFASVDCATDERLIIQYNPFTAIYIVHFHSGLHEVYLPIDLLEVNIPIGLLEVNIPIGLHQVEIYLLIINFHLTIGSTKDFLSIGPSNVHLTIGSTNDFLSIGPSNVHLTIGSTNDFLSIGPPNVHLTIGSTNDFLSIGSPNVHLTIGSTNDFLSIGPPNVHLTIGSTNDFLSIGPSNVHLTIGSTNDFLSIGPPNDHFTIGSTNDFLSIGPPNVHLTNSLYEVHLSIVPPNTRLPIDPHTIHLNINVFPGQGARTAMSVLVQLLENMCGRMLVSVTHNMKQPKIKVVKNFTDRSHINCVITIVKVSSGKPE